MADHRAVVSTVPPGRADPWTHPELFRGITGRRIFAYGIDLVAVSVLVAAVWFAFGILGLLSLGLLLPLQALAVALTPLAYHTLLLASPAAATLGMRMLGIRVATLQDDTASGRPTLFQAMIQTVAFYGSVALTSFLVLAVALFNPRRRTLHDWLAGTVVVNDPGRWHHPSA